MDRHTITVPPKTQAQLNKLLPLFDGNRSAAIHRAIDHLYRSLRSDELVAATRHNA
jgi:hypothetical protein